MFRLRKGKRSSAQQQVLPVTNENDSDDDSIYYSEAANARSLLERLYELKLEQENLELRHKRLKCKYSEAIYMHLKVSSALLVYSTYPLSLQSLRSRQKLDAGDDSSFTAKLKLICDKYDENLDKIGDKTWAKGGRGIDLLVQMKKPFHETLSAVETLVINGRL